MSTRRQALALLILTGCESNQQAQLPPFTEPPATGPLVEIAEADAGGQPLAPARVPSIRLDGEQWRARLTPLGFAVLRMADTEMAFTGKYSNHHETGIYRCAGCGTVSRTLASTFSSFRTLSTSGGGGGGIPSTVSSTHLPR